MRGRQCVGDSGILVSQPSPLGKGDRAAVDRVLSYIAYLRRSPSLSFIPLEPYPPLRGTFPSRGRQCVGDSGILVSLPSPLGKGDRAAVDRVLSYIAYLRRSPSLSFIPLEPYPPLRGTFPSRGRQCVGDSGILVSLPSPLGKGDRAAVDRVLSYIAYLRRSPSLSFIPLVPYPPLRGTFPSRGRQCVEDTLF